MIVRCSKCNSAFSIDDEKVRNKKFAFNCPKCDAENIFDNKSREENLNRDKPVIVPDLQENAEKQNSEEKKDILDEILPGTLDTGTLEDLDTQNSAGESMKNEDAIPMTPAMPSISEEEQEEKQDLSEISGITAGDVDNPKSPQDFSSESSNEVTGNLEEKNLLSEDGEDIFHDDIFEDDDIADIKLMDETGEKEENLPEDAPKTEGIPLEIDTDSENIDDLSDLDDIFKDENTESPIDDLNETTSGDKEPLKDMIHDDLTTLELEDLDLDLEMEDEPKKENIEEAITGEETPESIFDEKFSPIDLPEEDEEFTPIDIYEEDEKLTGENPMEKEEKTEGTEKAESTDLDELELDLDGDIERELDNALISPGVADATETDDESTTLNLDELELELDDDIEDELSDADISPSPADETETDDESTTLDLDELELDLNDDMEEEPEEPLGPLNTADETEIDDESTTLDLDELDLDLDDDIEDELNDTDLSPSPADATEIDDESTTLDLDELDLDLGDDMEGELSSTETSSSSAGETEKKTPETGIKSGVVIDDSEEDESIRIDLDKLDINIENPDQTAPTLMEEEDIDGFAADKISMDFEDVELDDDDSLALNLDFDEEDSHDESITIDLETLELGEAPPLPKGTKQESEDDKLTLADAGLTLDKLDDDIIHTESSGNSSSNSSSQKDENELDLNSEELKLNITDIDSELTLDEISDSITYEQESVVDSLEELPEIDLDGEDTDLDSSNELPEIDLNEEDMDSFDTVPDSHGDEQDSPMDSFEELPEIEESSEGAGMDIFEGSPKSEPNEASHENLSSFNAHNFSLDLELEPEKETDSPAIPLETLNAIREEEKNSHLKHDLLPEEERELENELEEGYAEIYLDGNVDFSIDLSLRYSRWGALFRLLGLYFLSMIPHLIVAVIYTLLSTVLGFINQIFVLVTGKHMEDFAQIVENTLRYFFYIKSAIVGVVEDRPIYAGKANITHQLQFSVRKSEKFSRTMAFLRLTMVGMVLVLLPHLLIMMILTLTIPFAYLAGIVIVLVTERWPRSLFNYITEYFRYLAKVSSYAVGITDKYPSFRF